MFDVSIPCVNGKCPVSLAAGKTLFVLGPNGSGKSSLLHHFAMQIPDELVKWIRAHRRSWFTSNVLELSPAEFQQQRAHHTQYLRRPDARYLTHDDGFDAQSSILFLIQRQNADARRIKDLLRENRDSDAKNLAQSGDILHTLNSALEQSSIPIVVSVGDKDDVLATKDSSTYGINEMSDGERSVLLLAAIVLTAEHGTCFLLDEPERHLHRAIISPLLSTLFRSRDDCTFVVSTHEVRLPMDNPDAEVILVRRCRFSNGAPAKWDLDLIGASQNLPEAARESILGARRNVIFVEGEKSSLDYPLYTRIFEDASVVPIGGRGAVISAVRSIRLSSDHHGIRAFGLVDGDYLDEDEVQRLEEDGVFVVDGYAVESIYYDSEVQRMVVKRTLEEQDAHRGLEAAKERVLATFRRIQTAEYLCLSRAKAMRRKMALVEIEKLDIAESRMELSGVVMLENEKSRLKHIVDKGEIDRLIREYDVKSTSALTDIARALGFRSPQAYESVVVHLLGDDADGLAYVRSRFRRLLDAMNEVS